MNKRGSGLYASFVKSGGGAAIPPPASLTSTARRSNPTAAAAAGGSSAPRRTPTLISASPFAPPASYRQQSSVNKQGYSDTTEPAVKRLRTEEEYFNDDDDDGENDLGEVKRGQSDDDDDDEEDPLDAFMANLEKDAKKEGLKSTNPNPGSKPDSSVRADIDEADDEESYYKWLEENPEAGKSGGDDPDEQLEVEYDEDGNPIYKPRPKYIDPLPPINHNELNYDAFEKNFYAEHPDIAGLTNIQVIDLQRKLGVRVSGANPLPKPVTSFAHFGFDEPLMKAIRRSDFSQPTPIQAQGVPALLGGRDVIGIAKTGSGKTAAFLWPMLGHIMQQPRLLRGDGPIGLVLVPTRELALQIYAEAKKFGRVHEVEVVCAYGGGSKWEQSKGFERGAEIAVATPGRMIDMIKMKVTNLERVTYLVLDEADRMFDLGFEPQVRSICDHVRPDRQCMLFSATFKKKIERLARDVLVDPVKIVQGSAVGEASEDVEQVVKVMQVGGFKWQWLLSKLVEFSSAGSVLVFVTKKANCEDLAKNLQVKEFDCRCLHGDLTQHERNQILHDFKKREFPVLVATDVAARGLDIPHIRTVVNYDVARDIDTHTHRVGRTGRAGVKGKAYTLLTEKDKEFAGHVVRNLEAANQDVPQDLLDLAMTSSWFRSSRFKKGGRALEYKERPGLGSSSGSSSSSGAVVIKTGTGGRMSTMKQAFKSSYLSNFRRATEDDGSGNKVGGVTESKQQQLMPPPPGSSAGNNEVEPPPPGEEKPKKRKSRWE